MIQTEGPGWLLIRDSSRENFSVMIGGDGWAIELTEQEWSELVQLVFDLEAQHRYLKNQLMPQEAISVELERLSWWGCLEGDRCSWSLRLILQGDHAQMRGAELFWPIPAAQAITTAMRTMWDSYQ